MGAQMAGGAVGTDLGIASAFPVSVPVGSPVCQRLVFRAEHAVIVLGIDILPPLVAALQGLWTLVGGGQHSSIFKYLFADVWSFVGGDRDNGLLLQRDGA